MTTKNHWCITFLNGITPVSLNHRFMRRYVSR